MFIRARSSSSRCWAEVLGPGGGVERVLERLGGLGGAGEVGGGLGGARLEGLLERVGGLPVGGIEAAVGDLLGEPAQLVVEGGVGLHLAGERLGLGLDGGDLGGGGGVDGAGRAGGPRQEQAHGEEGEGREHGPGGTLPAHLGEGDGASELVGGQLPVAHGPLQAGEEQTAGARGTIREHGGMGEGDAAGAGAHEPPGARGEQGHGEHPRGGLSEEHAGEHAPGGSGPHGGDAGLEPEDGVETAPHALDGREDEGLQTAFITGGHGGGGVSARRRALHKECRRRDASGEAAGSRLERHGPFRPGRRRSAKSSVPGSIPGRASPSWTSARDPPQGASGDALLSEWRPC